MSISNPTPQEVDAALADLNSAYTEFCHIVETRYGVHDFLQQTRDAYLMLCANFRFFKEAEIQIAYYDEAWRIAPTKPEPLTFERVIIYSWGHAESTPDASYDGGMELLQRVRRGNETFRALGVTYRITSTWPVTDETDTPVCGRIYATGVEILPQQ